MYTGSRPGNCFASYNPANWHSNYSRGNVVVVVQSSLITNDTSWGGVCKAPGFNNEDITEVEAPNHDNNNEIFLYVPHSTGCIKRSCSATGASINFLVGSLNGSHPYIHSMNVSCLNVSHVPTGYHPAPICSYKGRHPGASKTDGDKMCQGHGTRCQSYLPYCQLHFSLLQPEDTRRRRVSQKSGSTTRPCKTVSDLGTGLTAQGKPKKGSQPRLLPKMC
jgi:hypothetical protein